MAARRSSGFTIIELAIVLSLGAILTAIAVLRAGSFIDRIEVRGAVTEIESLFSLARHVAIARGAQSVLDIDTSIGELSIRVAAEQVTRRDVGRAHGVAITSNRTSMTYSPIGVGYGAANFTMVVTRGGEADSIVISRLGRVRH
jgi:prepilin-type N-terminal cleavage/methylation domain-containing protein